MGKILGKAKSVGKSYYFYLALYWIGLIGTVVITGIRYEVIAQRLNFDNWYEALLLIGVIYSLPVLFYTFLLKVTRTLAIIVAGIMFIIMLVIYGISTSGAELFIGTVKDALLPFLGLFLIYLGLYYGVKGGQKIKSK